MTERPEGTPGAPPDEPETAPEPETSPQSETVIGALEASEELMAESALEADEGEEDDEGEKDDEGDVDDEGEDEAVVPLGVEPAAPLVAATGTAAVPGRRQAPPPSVQRAPTQSELAVRVTDNASRLFVLGTAVIFVAILLWGLLGGVGGLLTATPGPTAAPSVSVEVSASPS